MGKFNSKDFSVEKILFWYNSGTKKQKQEGVEWYKVANLMATDIANDTGKTVSTVCGVISALSPQNRWESNVVNARNLIVAPTMETKVSTFNSNKVKAINIINGANPLDVLRGNKVISFYHNLMLNPDYVTIDRHAVRVAGGDMGTAITDYRYRLLTDLYKMAGEQVQVLSYQIQAITWTVFRENVVMPNTIGF